MNSKLITPSPVSSTPQALRRRVFIVDDHGFLASCLRTLIDHESGFVVCDVAAAEHGLTRRIETLRPDVVLLDLSVGRVGGFEVARSLRQAGIDVPILFVSSARELPCHQLSKIPDAAFAPKDGIPATLLTRLRNLIHAHVARPPRILEPMEKLELAGSGVA